MRRWLSPLLLLALGLGQVASASEIRLDENDDTRQTCSGMYSQKIWGGKVEPAITLKFTPSDSDKIVSVLVFEWEDRDFLGRRQKPTDSEKHYFCREDTVKSGLCNSTQIGEFLLEPDTKTKSHHSIFTQAVILKDAKPIRYPILRTGYYCVQAYGFTAKNFEAILTFRNSYGELSAAQIAKLPFYGGLTIVYAVIGILWGFLYVQHRRDILPVQNYITAIVIFIVIEMLFTWGFYEYTNNNGSDAISKVLLIIVSVLNAARNSFSFFLVLIVCMGYGVVKHTLGTTMTIVRVLAIAHFVFGLVYAIASLMITPEQAGPLVLLVILPLAGTLTAFYIWTLNSLKFTIADLLERKQNVKALMYRRLWWVLLGSIIVIFAFFFLNSFTMAGHDDPDFAPTHWKTRWFVLDGWLNLVYLVDFAVISYLWRPTANNRRFAMSDEISQDDDGFEIASLADSDDENDAEQGRAQGGPRENTGAGLSMQEEIKREREREAAEQRRREMERSGEEGEPIFAVDDHDGSGWSEDESSDDDKKPITKQGKKSD